MLGLTKPEPEEKECFFALQIDVGQIKSAIWTVADDQSQLLSLGEVVFWEKEEEILDKVDASLSSAVEKMAGGGEKKEPGKIIFGLSPEWVEQNKIQPEKAEILKKIAQKFELSPLGFVVIPEAIAHWLKKLEGVPPNAILIGLNQKKIAVSLVEAGRVIETSLVVRSGNLGSDLTEGLSRLGKETPYPARILLYDHEEKLEEARQELINWSWPQEGKIIFLHLPKIEILAVDFDIKALVLASASQIAEIKGFKEEPSVVVPPENPTPQTEPILETVKIEPESIFGFIKDQDIARFGSPPVEEPEFIPQTKPEAKVRFRPNFSFLFGWGDFLSDLFVGKGGFLILAGVILLVLLGGLGSFYWYFPKASIVLKVSPQVLEKDFTINLDPSLTTADKENLILPAKEIQTTVKQEKSKTTTGTKLVGDKAKGKVVVYNRTSKEKTLEAGVEINGANDLAFTLNEKVIVASESAGSDYVTIPGKVEVGVTAVKIGTEGNLASGSEFSIGNLAKSDFVAKNESSFAEGSSREIQSVAKEDQDQLLADLQKELEAKAVEDLKTKLSFGQKLVEESLTTQIVEKTFSQKIGDEADKISLSLQIKAIALSFSEDEFKQLAEVEIRSLVPADFDYDPSRTEINFQSQESGKKGIFAFTASFKADLVPKLDLENIKKNLLGKKPVIGQIYLDNLPHVDSFEVQITPRWLPESIATFPRVLKRLKIEVEVI